MFRKFAWLVSGAVIVLSAAVPAGAQENGVTVTRAVDVLEVEVSSAVTVAFPAPFQELTIADPEIADISSLSDRLVYLLGKSVGATTLTLIGSGTVPSIRNYRVVAYRDIAPMQVFLEQAAGSVSLDRTGTAVTVSGCVAGERQQRAVDGVLAQLSDWGFVTLTDVGGC